jgi:hypothetical protein
MIRVMSVRLQAIATVVVLTAVVFVVYRNHHRSPTTNQQLIGVLVAKSTIPKGTTGTAIRRGRLFKLAEMPQDQIQYRGGVIFSPTALAGKFTLFAGKTALHDIAPGSPLTLADFGRVTR